MAETTGSNARNLKLVATVVLIGLVIAVILQNTESVETKILFVSFQMPRAMLLAITLLVGFLGGVAYSARVLRRKES